jgi:hypothetical protein
VQIKRHEIDDALPRDPNAAPEFSSMISFFKIAIQLVAFEVDAFRKDSRPLKILLKILLKFSIG